MSFLLARAPCNRALVFGLLAIVELDELLHQVGFPAVVPSMGRARGLLEGLRAVLRALTDEDARLYLKARKSPQKRFLGAS